MTIAHFPTGVRWTVAVTVLCCGLCLHRRQAAADPGAAAVQAAPWDPVRQGEDLSIWRRAVPGSPIREVRVEATLRASSVRLWEVIRDVGSHTQFLPYVRESRLLDEPSPERRTYYQRISPPVVSDRDYTLRARAWADYQTGVFEHAFEVANELGPPPQAGVVRIAELRGRWTLEPVGPERTRIVYWVHMNPGGSIPAWVTNLGQGISLPKLFAAIEKRARDPGYVR